MQTFTEELYTYRRILFPSNQTYRLLIHCSFWIIFVGFHLLVFLPAHQERLTNPKVLYSYVLYYGRYIPMYYLTTHFFRLIRTRVTGTFRLILLGVFVFVIFHLITLILFRYYNRFISIENLPEGFGKISKLYLLSLDGMHVRDLTLFVYTASDLQLLMLPLSIKIVKYSVGLVAGESERREQKLRSELKYMRSQLTPHFIFNILNAVSAEIGRSSRKAQNILFKAADMIRFSIYDIEKEFIALEKELDYVKQYVELESMRTSQRSEIHFFTQGHVLQQHSVPTLFLVTLVENAFKHSVHATTDRSQVSIVGEVCDNWLTFEVTNTKPGNPVTEAPIEGDEGIGLANIQKTLALKFGKNYRLEINQDSKMFSVLLKLPLDCA